MSVYLILIFYLHAYMIQQVESGLLLMEIAFSFDESRIVHALMIAANVLSLHCAKMPYDPTPLICLAFGEDCQVMMRNRMGATKAISFGMHLAVFKRYVLYIHVLCVRTT